MKSLFAAGIATTALLMTAAPAQAQTEHSLKWHGPGILRGGDDDRARVYGRSNYYVAPYYGGYGYSYGYPIYAAPYGYGVPYGYGYTNPGFSFPTYSYSVPGYYWRY